jgi:hypothetical protein
VAVLIAWMALAFADPCGMVPPAWIPQGEPGIERTGDQETYVFFADGVQTIAIRPGFTGSVDEFGMLIPVPAVPALRKIADDTFAHLAAAVDPPTVNVDFYDPRELEQYAEEDRDELPTPSEAAVPARGLAFDTVRVVNQEAMGMYEVAVLEAGSPKALERWMTERRYRYPEGMDDVVLDYVQAGWLFVAVKTKVQAAGGVTPRPGMREVQPRLPKGAVFDGSVQGMAFRFRVPEPIVPMRLSTFNGEAAVNRVYMVADRPVRIVDRPTDLVRRQVAGKALATHLLEPLPVVYQNGSAKDVHGPFVERLAALRDPRPHNGVAHDLIAADLLALATGELTLPFEEVEKELLNVNEALGLRGAEVDKLVEDAIAERRDTALASQGRALTGYTLTVFDGDFGRSWLRANNLRFSAFEMEPGRNTAQSWTRQPSSAGYLSIPVEGSGGSWWPF